MKASYDKKEEFQRRRKEERIYILHTAEYLNILKFSFIIIITHTP